MRMCATAVSLAFALAAVLPTRAGAQEPAAVQAADPLAPAPDSAEATEAVEPPSEAVAQVTQWVRTTADNVGMPFLVIDKVAARVFLFDADGQFVDETPALFGITPGDDSYPGVGDRELADIPPEERTTSAGRYVAKFGPAPGHRNVLWIDYSTALSLHAVVTKNRKEKRIQRLESPSPEDNRITFGCINVPRKFYEDTLHDTIGKGSAVIYILPEIKPLYEVFASFRLQRQPAFQGATFGR